MLNEMGPEWVKEQQARNVRMEALYKLDERDKPGHPHAGTYTGLHQEIEITERHYQELLTFNKWKARGYPDLPLPQ